MELLSQFYVNVIKIVSRKEHLHAENESALIMRLCVQYVRVLYRFHIRSTYFYGHCDFLFGMQLE